MNVNPDIHSLQIGIRNLRQEDINDLYEWRNHPATRSNSFTTDLITWETHEKWFKEKISNPNSIIYIAYCDERKIGSVRFDIEKYKTLVSVMLNPDFQRRRLAAHIIRLGVDRFIKEKGVEKIVIAEVKKGNVASEKAFQRAGFLENYVTYVFSPDSELNNENNISK